MKLVKLALLGAAMMALSACDKTCDKCDCKVPDNISQSEAYKIFKGLYAKMTTNAVFNCQVNFYDKNEDDSQGDLRTSIYMNEVQVDEDYIEFISSTKPEVLRFLADRNDNNKLYELDDEGNWSATTYGKFEVGSSSLEPEMGSAYLQTTKELKRITDLMESKDALLNYKCEDYVCSFDYFYDTITMECSYGKGGLTVKRLSINLLQGFGYNDHIVNFTSYGDAAPTHLA